MPPLTARLFLNFLANGTLRLLRIEPIDELQSAHTSEELGLMISEAAKGGTIDRFEHRLLAGAIALSADNVPAADKLLSDLAAGVAGAGAGHRRDS